MQECAFLSFNASVLFSHGSSPYPTKSCGLGTKLHNLRIKVWGLKPAFAYLFVLPLNICCPSLSFCAAFGLHPSVCALRTKWKR